MWKVEYRERRKKKSRKKSRKRTLTTYFLYCFYFFTHVNILPFQKAALNILYREKQFNIIARIQKIIQVLRNWLWPFGKIPYY